jgi:predicted phosphodiesterase
MRVAALYDIHGNLPALEAVVVEVRDAGVDEVIVGGDVLPGPMPVETLDLLAALEVPVRYLRGNGDRETLAAVDGLELVTVPAAYQPPVRWGAAELRTEQIAWIRTWPVSLTFVLPGIGPVLFCHATPRSDTEIFTRVTPEARIAVAFGEVRASLVVCGHTHMQFNRLIAGVRVVNAGSVGMPFGEAGAYWLLLDGDGPHFRRTPFDLEAAAMRIRATAYPGAEAFAANHVLAPPAEAQMIAAFESR